MKKLRKIICLMSIAGLLVSINLFAQNQGGKMMNQRIRMYDVNTVQTLKGEVTNIGTITGKRGFNTAYPVLKTDSGKIDIHLGPESYLENQAMKIVNGDQIEVTGSKITYKDKPVILAAEISKGDETLKLRDSSGIPLWRGQGMRNK
jgi:DNA/RNA endonuclease YhcR with UshA esterase domain